MHASTILILIMLSSAAFADVVVPIEEVESYVKIRSAPDASSDAISRLHKSKPRPHVDTLDGWYEVELEDGTTGFVSSDWSVLLADDEPDAHQESLVTATASAAEAVTEKAQEPVTSRAEQTPDEQKLSEKAESKQASSVAAPPETERQEAAATEEPVEDSNASKDIVAKVSVMEPEVDGKAEVTQRASAEPIVGTVGQQGPAGPQGPRGPAGPQGPPGDGAIKGTENLLVKFKNPTVGGNSQIFDDGNRVGIGTDEPEQRLDVNGSLQIHDRTSAVAGVMITQIRGETGYILHNQASTLTIGAGSVDRITIDKDGNIGFGVNQPEYPLQLASGAYVSAGGVWTNSSSRARKENIDLLTVEDALAALSELEPVEFNYRGDAGEKHLGFIAEDVPDLIATTDRKSLSPMDIVAVLTRVVQEQQERIQTLEQRIAEQD